MASILQANDETVKYRKFRGDKPRPITQTRALEMAQELKVLSDRDPMFFYGVLMPNLWEGAGFWNGANDTGLKRSKWTWGYSELQIGTAWLAGGKNHGMPKDKAKAEVWLVQEWRTNLLIGYDHMHWLWTHYKRSDLKALNAYRTGPTGFERDGKWVINKRLKGVRAYCLMHYAAIQRLRAPNQQRGIDG